MTGRRTRPGELGTARAGAGAGSAAHQGDRDDLQRVLAHEERESAFRRHGSTRRAAPLPGLQRGTLSKGEGWSVRRRCSARRPLRRRELAQHAQQLRARAAWAWDLQFLQPFGGALLLDGSCSASMRWSCRFGCLAKLADPARRARLLPGAPAAAAGTPRSSRSKRLRDLALLRRRPYASSTPSWAETGRKGHTRLSYTSSLFLVKAILSSSPRRLLRSVSNDSCAARKDR